MCLSPLRLLSLLTLLGASQASALYCVPPITPDPIDLNDVSTLTLNTTGTSGMTINRQHTYQGGLLRSVNTTYMAVFPSLSGNTKVQQFTSSTAETWQYTPAGQLTLIDMVFNNTYRPAHIQEGHEYDAQGRLMRVMHKSTPRSAWVTLATCSYAPGRVTEHQTEVQGFKPTTTVFTLDAGNRVTHVTRTIQGHEQDTDVTTMKRDDRGVVTHTETRVMDTTTPLKVTVTTYNSAGLPVQAVESTYSKDDKLTFKLTTTFEYVLDSRGNWTKKVEHRSTGGPHELESTETRAITYRQP